MSGSMELCPHIVTDKSAKWSFNTGNAEHQKQLPVNVLCQETFKKADLNLQKYVSLPWENKSVSITEQYTYIKKANICKNPCHVVPVEADKKQDSTVMTT